MSRTSRTSRDQPQEPRVSPLGRVLDVVVVSHESEGLLGEALDALPCDARVVVVDNRSLDQSVEVARAHGAAVVVNEVNAGFGTAANQGAAVGDAELVLFLNPDARIEVEDLRRVVQHLDAHPGTAVAGPRLAHGDGSFQRGRWPYPTARESWRWALGGRRCRPLPDDDGGPRGGFVVGACLLVRRAAFEAIGGFDARYWLYAEETDLCWRLHQAGYGVDLVAEASARHVGGASGDSASPLIVEHFDRGSERFILEHDGRAALVSHRVATLLGTGIRSLRGGERRQRIRRRRVARLLVSSPTSVSLTSPATEASDETLVVCSLEPWDETLRRNQLLVGELLLRRPHLRVLFVEPPLDRLHQLRTGGRPGHGRQRGLRSVRADGRVLAFQPVKDLPRVVGPFADRALRRQVRGAARRAGFVRPTLWINDASYAPLLAETGWPAVYDITDDWLEAATTARALLRLERAEADLLAHADEVVVCSPGLVERRQEQRPDLHLIPNAVDATLFGAPQPRPDDLPSGPTAVYVGTLHEDRLDVDLVAQLAAAADLSVVLVGPDALAEGARRRLEEAGVHLLGPRPHASVPGYLQHADVVVVPHVVSPFTESLDPIKAYECLAVGRPTVATEIAGFRELGVPVEAVRREAFVATVVARAREDRAAEPQVVPSWAERADAFEGVLRLARADDAERPLRVLRVWHSGVMRTWRGRERALRDAGVDLTLVSASSWNEGGRDVAFEAGDDFAVPVATVGRHPFRFAYSPVRLYRLLRRGQLDLLDLHEEPASIAAAEVLALRHLARCDAPYLLYSAQNIEKRYPPPFRWIERYALRHAAGVHVCNVDAGRILQDKGLEGEVEVLGLGVDLESFGWTWPSARPSGPTIGYVGRLEAHKGVDVLVDALAELPGATLRLVGEGPARKALEQQAERLGVDDRVDLVGFVGQDELPGEYRRFDVLAVPSMSNPRWTEQFGRVVVEAMAVGVPVVASRCGELPVVVGDAGLLVEPGDPVALAAALTSVLSSPAEHARLVAAGLVQAEQYTWPAIAESQLALYRRVVA
jgi:glycosyltransferase involved in cell wall biosynthesis